MKKLDSLEYLSKNKWQRFVYNLQWFFYSIPGKFANFFKKIGRGFVQFFVGIANVFKNIFLWFKEGDWKTRVSYVVMGFGLMARKQWLRGLLFLFFEVAFILYMVFFGGRYLGQLGTLGTVARIKVWNDAKQVFEYIDGDNSLLILLYAVISLFILAAFAYMWYLNLKQNHIAQEMVENDKKLESAGDDLRRLVDRDFYKTLLTLPTIGIVVFTIIPIIFMVLVAFTNYDGQHQPPENLFTWSTDAWSEVFAVGSSGGASFSMTFGAILLWTVVWAFFATFTNYFLGMLVAMLINKKGIKLKKLWRTILVVTISVPQFVSLLFVSKMFNDRGIVNGLLMTWGWIKEPIPFWTDPWLARITVIVINIWIGIPYLMLITTGILMNIPADLYESAQIDGASPWQQYRKITLPYMLFVTGPYLLTSFTGNMNNFNVIYLLSGGAPVTGSYYKSAGQTDLLITWLFKVTLDQQNYKLASVIGIFVFIVMALISLIVYNIIPSTKHEEDYQ